MDWSYPLLDSEGTAVSNISQTRTSAPIVQGAGLVTFEMPKACRYVRLVVNTTVASVVAGTLKTNGDGFNFWNASELRAYKAALDPNCVYEHMDKNVKDELDAAIAAAKAEVAAKTSTQATIDRLQAAIDAFNAVYPDINKLKEAIVNKWKQESEDNQLMHVVEDTDDTFLAKDEYSPNEFAVNVFTQPRMTVSQILDELDSDGFFI